MKCRRAFDVDLPAVLRGESSDADFLAHVPGCPDCATEVGVWRELEGMLRSGAPAAMTHPDPAALVAFLDAPATLAGALRAEVERHLPMCRVCSDEVRALRGYDSSRAAARAVSAASASVPPREVAAGASRSRSVLARVVWHPAFAYALVAVLLVPVVRAQLPQVEGRMPVPQQVAEAPATESASGRNADVPPAGMGALRDEASARKDERVAAAPVESRQLAAAPREVPRAEAPNAEKQSAAAPAPPRVADSAAPGKAAREAAPLPPPASMRAKRAADAGDEAAGLAERDTEAATARLAQAAPAGAATAGAASDSADQDATQSILEELKRRRAEPQIPRGQLPRILQVGPQGTPTFVADDGKRRVELRVVPPADLAAGPLDLTVRGRAGQPEVRQRVADPAKAIVVAIPPGWLVAGQYSVELQPVGGDGTPAGRATVLGFSAHAADAATP